MSKLWVPKQKCTRYEHFVTLISSVFGSFNAELRSLYGTWTGISFVDSTSLAVCDNHHIHANRVFMVNDCGELLARQCG